MPTSFLQQLHPVVPFVGPSAVAAAVPSRGRLHLSVARAPHATLRVRAPKEGC